MVWNLNITHEILSLSYLRNQLIVMEPPNMDISKFGDKSFFSYVILSMNYTMTEYVQVWQIWRTR